MTIYSVMFVIVTLTCLALSLNSAWPSLTDVQSGIESQLSLAVPHCDRPGFESQLSLAIPHGRAWH